MKSGFEALIDQLAVPSFNRRRKVIRELADHGDAALPALVRQLVDRRGDETCIAATVEVLVRSAGDVEGALVPLHAHPNHAVVADVAQVLGRRRSSRSIDVLVAMMEHENDNVAVTAIEALGRIGGRAAVDHLLRAIRCDQFFRVFPAIDVLGRTGDPRAIEPLERLLARPLYALEAARALGRTGQPAAIRPLVKLLGDAGVYVRVAAVALEELRRRCFEQFGAVERFDADLSRELGGQEQLVNRLMRSFEGSEPEEQAAAARILGAIGGEEALGALLSLLEGPSRAAEAAAQALRAMTPLPVEALGHALAEGSSRMRAVLLPRIDQPEFELAVRRTLADPDEQVRVAAIRSLVRMARSSAAPAIFECLEDESGLVRQAALTALLAIGGPELERRAMWGADSKGVLTRRASLRILGHFGFPGAERRLLAALEDPDRQCRDIALQGLVVFDSKEAVAAILSRATAKDRDTRSSAVRAMGRLDPAIARDALHAALEDSEEWVRYYACRSVGRLEDQSSRAAVIERLDDPAKLVRIAAIDAIAHLGGREAAEILAGCAESEDEDVRRAGVVGLGIVGGSDARAAIERALGASDPATRLLALSALEKTRSEASLSRVIAMIDDSDIRVRNAAFETLADWPGPDAAAALRDLLHSHPGDDRFVEALARPVSGRLEVLIEALLAADETHAPLLTAALARNGSIQAVAALQDVLARGTTPARKEAASALIASGNRAQQNAVREAVAAEKDPEVRRVVSALLAKRT